MTHLVLTHVNEKEGRGGTFEANLALELAETLIFDADVYFSAVPLKPS